MKKLGILLALPLAMVLIAGCGSKPDSQKPIDQVRTEAEKMNLSQLESTAKSYAKEIQKQSAGMEEIQAKLRQLKPTELFSDKAKSIKDEASKVASEVSGLTDRYNVYAQQFQKAGGDLSKIKLS